MAFKKLNSFLQFKSWTYGCTFHFEYEEKAGVCYFVLEKTHCEINKGFVLSLRLIYLWPLVSHDCTCIRDWLYTQALGAIELFLFAGGHTDVDGQRECTHTHVHALLRPHKARTFLVPLLDFISSLDQLSFPVFGICTAHFRVITLDLLNHCFLAFIW